MIASHENRMSYSTEQERFWASEFIGIQIQDAVHQKPQCSRRYGNTSLLAADAYYQRRLLPNCPALRNNDVTPRLEHLGSTHCKK